jgi:hypothetical protein
MTSKKAKTLKIVCPHCHCGLKVDAGSGDILLVEPPENREVESFEDALEIERRHEERKAGLFEEAIRMERKRKQLLEKKFRESQNSTEDDGSPPPSPFDFS